MRAHAVVVAVVVAVSGPGSLHAGPLPDGTKVVLVKDQLWFVDHGITVPLFDSRSREGQWDFDSLVSAKLSDDGKTIEIGASSCSALMAHDTATATFDVVRARVENVRGMQLHLKKRYADAVGHFAAAVKLDPSTPVYATNLLSAQSMGKLLDDADKTLATAGARAVAWFAWRLAVDSDLANLRGRASTKPFTAIVRTKVASGSLETSIGVSPAGYFALPDSSGGGMGPMAEDLVVYDPHGVEQLRVPVIAFEDLCMESECTKSKLAHTAEHQRAAAELLGMLGFTMQPLRWVEMSDLGRAVSPDKQLSVAVVDDKVTIAHGKATSTAHLDGPVFRVGFATSAIVIQARITHGCGGTDNTWGEWFPFAAP